MEKQSRQFECSTASKLCSDIPFSILEFFVSLCIGQMRTKLLFNIWKAGDLVRRFLYTPHRKTSYIFTCFNIMNFIIISNIYRSIVKNHQYLFISSRYYYPHHILFEAFRASRTLLSQSLRFLSFRFNSSTPANTQKIEKSQYRKCNIGASKNAIPAFSTPRRLLHFLYWLFFYFRLFLLMN